LAGRQNVSGGRNSLRRFGQFEASDQPLRPPPALLQHPSRDQSLNVAHLGQRGAPDPTLNGPADYALVGDERRGGGRGEEVHPLGPQNTLTQAARFTRRRLTVTSSNPAPATISFSINIDVNRTRESRVCLLRVVPFCRSAGEHRRLSSSVAVSTAESWRACQGSFSPYRRCWCRAGKPPKLQTT
jgi:hypothetical protein